MQERHFGRDSLVRANRAKRLLRAGRQARADSDGPGKQHGVLPEGIRDYVLFFIISRRLNFQTRGCLNGHDSGVLSREEHIASSGGV